MKITESLNYITVGLCGVVTGILIGFIWGGNSASWFLQMKINHGDCIITETKDVYCK